MAKLTHEMMETERLDAERKGLFARIEALERGGNGANGPTGPVDVNKTMADANMKLKLEVGPSNHGFKWDELPILPLTTNCNSRLET